MAPLVTSPQMRSSSLHNPLPPYLRVYSWPFAILWAIYARIYFSEELYDDYFDSSEWATLFFGLIGGTQTLMWLSTKWSATLRARFTTSSTSNPYQASLIKVVPIADSGAPEFCEIKRGQGSDTDSGAGTSILYFNFQRLKFIYNPTSRSFEPLSYDIDQDPKPLISHFKHTKGLDSESRVNQKKDYYGLNIFDIPMPTFVELFKEHAVAPLFVFQVACVGLWLLDDYWYYSLFSLFMLVVFESTVVYQRLTTLSEFRDMSVPEYDINVYRSGTWVVLKSNQLLPGDVVSVQSTKEGSGVACDMLLIEGSLIVNEAMLTGESTPVRKDSIGLRSDNDRIDPDGIDKASQLFGGTQVMQILAHGRDEVAAEDNSKETSEAAIPPPPDGGAIAVVLKTGFQTGQGSLMRTMLFATESASASNSEALWFILLLLVFAIMASWYVWEEGVEHDRKRSNLLLDCTLIITSVVPPELPLQLSLAVNTSLGALRLHRIFCTEPFRIPFAGRVDVACFDKTGTLTGESPIVSGVVCPSHPWNPTPPTEVTAAEKASPWASLVMATAHSLAILDDKEVVGEPMEKETVAAVNWELVKEGRMEHKNKKAPISAMIRRQFPFSSALKRQGCISILHNSNGQKITFAAVKGAPEVIWKMIKEPCPRHTYDSYYKQFTREGSRVLALAYKILSDTEMPGKKIESFEREEIESDLVFAGFLVLQTPLKEDAIEAIDMLNKSSHRSVMITGDNPLTAIYVAGKVKIVERECRILDRAPDKDDLAHLELESSEVDRIVNAPIVMRDISDNEFIPIDPQKPLDEKLFDSYDLCLTGYAIEHFQPHPSWESVLKRTWVYARVSPKQKEDILIGLKRLGYITLMCGDGTNDVGALKQAHVGVALLNGQEKDMKRGEEHDRIMRTKAMYDKQVDFMKKWSSTLPSSASTAPKVPALIAHLYPPGPNNPYHKRAVEHHAAAKGLSPSEFAADPLPTDDGANEGDNRLNKLQEMLMSAELETDAPMVKLGDASCAAPFTSKLADVGAIPNIIRQGRCTLVATIQMYKILALNCLISAYTLSVLYLDGIKFGDGQHTISGILMSICFMSISRAKPVDKLSKERPQNNIFNVYILGSIFGQFAIHIATLIFISRYVQKTEPLLPVDVDAETEFEPSLLNSAMYLLQLVQQISTFAVNYQGRPFRESIRESKVMFYSLCGVAALAFSCALELVPELNEQIQMVPFSSEFQLVITSTMAFDFIGCWLVENGLKRIFADYKPKDIAIRKEAPSVLEQVSEKS